MTASRLRLVSGFVLIVSRYGLGGVSCLSSGSSFRVPDRGSWERVKLSRVLWSISCGCSVGVRRSWVLRCAFGLGVLWSRLVILWVVSCFCAWWSLLASMAFSGVGYGLILLWGVRVLWAFVGASDGFPVIYDIVERLRVRELSRVGAGRERVTISEGFAVWAGGLAGRLVWFNLIEFNLIVLLFSFFSKKQKRSRTMAGASAGLGLRVGLGRLISSGASRRGSSGADRGFSCLVLLRWIGWRSPALSGRFWGVLFNLYF